MKRTPYIILRRTWIDYGTSAFYEKLKIASWKTMVFRIGQGHCVSYA